MPNVYAHSGAVVGLCVQRALDLFMSRLRRVPARVENTPNIFSNRKKRIVHSCWMLLFSFSFQIGVNHPHGVARLSSCQFAVSQWEVSASMQATRRTEAHQTDLFPYYWTVSQWATKHLLPWHDMKWMHVWFHLSIWYVSIIMSATAHFTWSILIAYTGIVHHNT